jgi:hypothetical protein
VFWVISVYFNIRNTLPKFFTFLPGHPVYPSMKITGSETKRLTTLIGNVILKNNGGETTRATTILSNKIMSYTTALTMEMLSMSMDTYI